MKIGVDNWLAHYGTPRKSGRYPWGSGGENFQSGSDFLGYVDKMRKAGLSESDIAKGIGLSTTQLRAEKSIAKNERKAAQISEATRLKAKGMSNVAIAEQMKLNESSVRALLAPAAQDKIDVLTATSNMLKDQVAEKGYIDVGIGVERQIGISKEKLGTAVEALKAEGYVVHNVQIDQLGTGAGNKTLVKVLAPEGTTYRDIVTDPSKIQQITAFSDDGGRTVLGIAPPLSLDSKRVGVVYAEDGGDKADGVMYIRPGVEDLSLGGANYAQVRIAVDGTHYLKGMAVYKNDMPDGVDVLFNTNKSSTGNNLDAMKKMSDDPDNPFGAVVRQIGERDASGSVVKPTSAMNIVNEEGDWDGWSRNLSTQMLSKQSSTLARTQLDLTFKDKLAEFEEIKSLTNPAVKAKLLQEFSDGVDASSIHLKAAALPRQRSQVILPVNSMKETEVFAPNFRDGERVVLIRYPHGGIFEIPELTVNNRNREAKSILGQAKDAIGINSKVAARLSGADFDGDTVLVIPNSMGKIKTMPALEKLKGFDPQSTYPKYDGMKTIDGGTYNAKTGQVEFPPGKASSPRGKGIQMGLVSNLITDMTIQDATPDELARAVRHSMVVIDAEKHVLNYKQSSIDNGIPGLMTKYQGRSGGGSATLISRSGMTSKEEVNERKPRKFSEGGPIDPTTGRKVYTETGASYVNSKGKLIIKKDKIPKLEATDDANTLSSGTPIEKIYADHSNRLKGLANEARKEMLAVRPTPISPSAKVVYSKEVKSLDSKLHEALKNAPLERQAQIIANATVSAKTRGRNLDPPSVKKIKYQALDEARRRTGAGKQRVEITDREWEAIQAGAISQSKLGRILDNANMEKVRSLATPRASTVVTSAKMARAQALLAAGYTQAEVADAVGIGLTTLKTNLKSG